MTTDVALPLLAIAGVARLLSARRDYEHARRLHDAATAVRHRILMRSVDALRAECHAAGVDPVELRRALEAMREGRFSTASRNATRDQGAGMRATGARVENWPGWTDVSLGRSKLSRRFLHTTGWRIEHCGHPTANWPWAVYDPRGVLHTSGQACDLGYAFRRLADALEHVQRHLDGDLAA